MTLLFTSALLALTLAAPFATAQEAPKPECKEVMVRDNSQPAWKAIETDQRYLRTADPWRYEFRPEGEDHQSRHMLHPFDHQFQQIESSRIAPVHVLVHRKHRLLGGQARELIDQRFKRPLLLRFGRQVERRIALAGRDRQQRGRAGPRACRAWFPTDRRVQIPQRARSG